MAEWLDGLEKFAPGPGGLIRNILSPESIPNKVLEVKKDRFKKRTIQVQEESMIMYAADNKCEVALVPSADESSSKAFRLFHLLIYYFYSPQCLFRIPLNLKVFC